MSIYQNPNQPIAVRVEDLLAQMTLEEKVAQLSCIMPHMLIGEEIPDPNLMRRFMKHGLGRMTQFASMFINDPREIARFANRIQQFVLEETRLGIPLLFQNEALNGFTAVKATNFPTPIALASTLYLAGGAENRFFTRRRRKMPKHLIKILLAEIILFFSVISIHNCSFAQKIRVIDRPKKQYAGTVPVFSARLDTLHVLIKITRVGIVQLQQYSAVNLADLPADFAILLQNQIGKKIDWRKDGRLLRLKVCLGLLGGEWR